MDMGILKKLFLGLLILGATACTSLWDSDIGRPIKFGIAPNASTRASYAEIAGGEIDWDPDDQVGIYMFWNGPGDQPRSATYNVLPIGGSENYGELSIDSKTSVSLTWQGYFKDGKAVEYEHTFISSHPPRALTEGGFIFELPENQNGTTEHLFLTCYEAGVQSGTRENGDVVFLHYYPAVTTLVVTVEDEANKLPTKSGTLTLFSENKNLVGSFRVYPGDRDRSVTVLEGKPSVEVPFEVNKPLLLFLIPVQHPPNELSFSLNGSDKKVITDALEPFVKYRATISTSKDEPEVDGPFSSFVNGVVLAEAHKRGEKWQMEDGVIKGEFQVWHDNSPWGGWYENTWMEVPSELLWEIINNLVDLDIENTWEVTEILPEDLNIFPKLKTVNIKSTNLTSIAVSNPNITELNITSEAIHTVKVEGCDSLKTFDISSKNNIADVVVKGNKILEYFTMSGPAGAGVNVLCENCPVLEWFSLTGGEGWNFPFHKDIINCPMFDHYDVPGCQES